MPDAIPGAPKHPWGKWPKVDPSTIAPLRDGIPDFYHYQPTRFVSREEATARGWKHFWTGELCVTGHRAARYVCNTSQCSDCERVKKGKVPVYGKGVPELEAARRRNYTQKKTQHLTAGPPVPNAAERNFLAKYAEHKDFAAAAEACGRDESEFLAILSWNTTFRDAVNRLEESLGVGRTQKVTEAFEWDDDKRQAFLITYANTADMKQALRAVRATNVQFHKELTENSEFQRAFDDANQTARSVFDHAASANAIKGDARMLGRIAANMFPEKFGENLKMDLKVTQNMTLDQSHAQLANLLSRFDRQGLLPAPESADESALEAEYEVVESSGDDETVEYSESESAEPGPDPNSDLVSGSE